MYNELIDTNHNNITSNYMPMYYSLFYILIANDRIL